ncbi:MAG: sigma-70 family RNA polymerase sigma factor [Kiritimatiellae bacterium]|nr:sigma-70 family RNA polymerase sigma factor [Kiritimatiellia bacterium]
MTEKDQTYWDAVVAAVQRGDVDRFREVVMEFQDSMRFAVAFHVRGNANLIDEIVHRAFIRAYRALDRFELGKPLGPWLKQIARNEALKEVRTLCRQARLKSQFLQAAVAEARTDLEPPVDQLARLRQCIDNLQLHARKMVRMRYFDKMSFDAMAETLGRTAGALRVAMLGIRRSLKTCVEGNGGR